jgi:hypothetical protein
MNTTNEPRAAGSTALTMIPAWPARAVGATMNSPKQFGGLEASADAAAGTAAATAATAASAVSPLWILITHRPFCGVLPAPGTTLLRERLPRNNGFVEPACAWVPAYGTNSPAEIRCPVRTPDLPLAVGFAQPQSPTLTGARVCLPRGEHRRADRGRRSLRPRLQTSGTLAKQGPAVAQAPRTEAKQESQADGAAPKTRPR